MERCPDGHSACKFSAQSMNIVAKICGHDSSKRGNEKCSQSQQYATYRHDIMHKVSSIYCQYIPEVSER